MSDLDQAEGMQVYGTLTMMMRLSVADWLKSKMTRSLRKATDDAEEVRLSGSSATQKLLVIVMPPNLDL